METFQQPKIAGYRQLTPAEAELMSRAKALGTRFDELIAELRRYHKLQRTTAAGQVAGQTSIPGSTPRSEETARLDVAEPERWLSMGRTDIQTGVMKIVRSIAQPSA